MATMGRAPNAHCTMMIPHGRCPRTVKAVKAVKIYYLHNISIYPTII